MSLFCKNIVLSHDKSYFYWSSKIQVLQPIIQVTRQNNRPELFAVNDAVQKLRFKKLRRSHPEIFLGRVVLKICSKFTGEHSCCSSISIKLLCNFIEIALQHGCSPVNLLHIFRTPFLSNTSGRLLPKTIHGWELPRKERFIILHNTAFFLFIYFKGTLRQIWKLSYVFVFIKKQYSKNLHF